MSRRRFQTILALSVLMTSVPMLSGAQKDYRPFNGHKDKAYLSRYNRAKASVHKRFTAEQRTRIAGELAKSEGRAADAARQRVPVTATAGTPAANKQQNQQSRLSMRLNRQFQAQTRARYHLTPEEAVIINREAVSNAIKTNR